MPKLIQNSCAKVEYKLRTLNSTNCEPTSTEEPIVDVVSHTIGGQAQSIHQPVPHSNTLASTGKLSISNLLNTFFTQYPQPLLIQLLKRI